MRRAGIRAPTTAPWTVYYSRECRVLTEGCMPRRRRTGLGVQYIGCMAADWSIIRVHCPQKRCSVLGTSSLRK